MLSIVFFAQTREIIGQGGLTLPFESAFSDLEMLRAHLANTNDKWDLALTRDKLLVAVNQEMSPWDTEIKDGDEVAFFPPVTGG
ncbi:molybdopterin synthase sulfur carrier subunit [Psychrobium sp. nBUS_13]|uniref:molybdopterin synthase sulfur carrier subunit n=1 Tax=Psychrobium sp. nBUS_13 TaxID=3395319 RepID=UPI003EC0F5D4